MLYNAIIRSVCPREAYYRFDPANKRMKALRKIKSSYVFVLSVMAIVIIFGIYYILRTDSKRMVAFLAAVCAILIAQYAAYSLMKAKGCGNINVCTFAIGLSLWGILFLALFPPLSIPDEPYHYFAAYQLSDALMFLGIGQDNVLPMRVEDADFISTSAAVSTQLQASSYGDMARAIVDMDVQPDIVYYQLHDHGISQFDLPANLASNPFQDRLAPALGLTVGRLLGLNAMLTFYMGRLFSLALFVFLTCVAVKTTPIGKAAMMTVAMLPMTLHLAGSYSYDSFTIAMSFLLIAMVLDVIVGRKRMGTRDIGLIALVAALLAPCKVVYSLSVLLILFAKVDQFDSKRTAVIAKFAVIGSAAVSLLAFRAADLIVAFSHTENAETIGADARGGENGEFYDLAFILQHLDMTLGVYGRSFILTLEHNARTLVGGALGWFQGNIQAPIYILIALYVVLLLSCLKSRNDCEVVAPSIRIASGALVALCWLAVMTSMLVGWTFNTENVISGLQGRYLLPVLPLLLIAFSPKRIESSYNMDFWCPFLLCSVIAVYVLNISASVLIG